MAISKSYLGNESVISVSDKYFVLSISTESCKIAHVGSANSVTVH